MINMEKSSVEKYLRGQADNQETRQAEDLLSRRETVMGDHLEATAEDSLWLALRAKTPPLDAPSVHEMAARLEPLIPPPAISPAEIRGLLDLTDDPVALGQIGKYRVTQYLAGGGMGLVFRATDIELDREVCLKLLHPKRAQGEEARTRFQRESRSIAKLNSDRIMPVLDIGTHRELPFLVMPLLDGMSLRSRLIRDGQLPPTKAIEIAIQIAEGLELAHRMGVLHRDIKPDNLWITPTDDIKLFDFGLARNREEATSITHEGTVLGTPSYMSPEQVTGTPLDDRSDLFSLGVVLVEMLAGESPFQKNNLIGTLMSVASDEIEFAEIDPQGKIPANLRAIIADLLQKDPLQRPGTATEVVDRLNDCLASLNSQTSFPAVCLTLPNAEGGRRSWWPTMAAALGGFAICLAAFAFWQMNDKGTLIVETHDSQVEVKIVGEVVSVVDPLTERSFQIQIGSNPLPSGVYQLELN